MEKIDAHTHVGNDDANLIRLLEEARMQFLNICVAVKGWRDNQAAVYSGLAKKYPGQFAWITTFDLPDFEDPRYAERAIEALAGDLEKGTVGCKIWKHVGMEVKNPDGAYVLPDDPIFDPIYNFVAESGKTLLMHIAEPIACWQPLDENSIHYRYFSTHPEWHFYGRADAPSHEALIASRDRVIEKHPGLRVVGAHIGSMEHDVAMVATRLDRYPNFAVDIAARLENLIEQPTEIVRRFFLDHQDRILFGTDTSFGKNRDFSALPGDFERHFTYLETSDMLPFQNRQVRGLELPRAVLERILFP